MVLEETQAAYAGPDGHGCSTMNAYLCCRINAVCWSRESSPVATTTASKPESHQALQLAS